MHVEVAPDGSAAAMLSIVPDFDLDPEPTEIVFLVDCSGSMGGERIEAAKRALQVCLSFSLCRCSSSYPSLPSSQVFVMSLPQSCYFNIVKFGSSSQQLFRDSSQAYTQVCYRQRESEGLIVVCVSCDAQSTLSSAQSYIASTSANLGYEDRKKAGRTLFVVDVSLCFFFLVAQSC